MMSHSELERRIGAWLDGRISDAESETLQQELRESSEARATFERFAQLDAVMREVADTESVGAISLASGTSFSTAKRSATLYFRASLVLALGIIVAVTATLYVQHRNSNRSIARIKGLNGSLIWIGDGGQMRTRWSNVLSEEAELPGGTIEGTAPDSWFELEFHDGSTAMIFGDSVLTFSDQGQKELRLKQGRLSASVVPQPAGEPMLLHTPAADLKVVGTQFDVEAGPESTMLYVREGKVQIRRLSDGKTVDVPAGYRVISAADSDMVPQSLTTYIEKRRGYDYSKHGQSDNPYLDFITEDIVREFAVLGDPDSHIVKLQALQKAGITQFNIYLDSGHEEKIIADYGETIIPAFNE